MYLHSLFCFVPPPRESVFFKPNKKKPLSQKNNYKREKKEIPRSLISNSSLVSEGQVGGEGSACKSKQNKKIQANPNHLRTSEGSNEKKNTKI